MSDIVEPASLATYPSSQTSKFDEQEYVDWVRRQLGAPDIEVELTSENIKDSMKEALAVYSKFKPRHITESWVAADGLSQRGLTSVSALGARGVYNLELQGVTDGLNSPNIEAQMMSGSFAYYGVAAPKFDLRYYEYARQWVKMASRILSSEGDYHMSDDGRSIYIYSPGRMTKVTATLVLDHVSPDTIPSHDQYWVRKYVLAQAKIILGRKRSKFTSIPGANKDISLDGAALITEGREDIKELETKLEKMRTHLTPSWG
jgi:hypothetical protein